MEWGVREGRTAAHQIIMLASARRAWWAPHTARVLRQEGPLANSYRIDGLTRLMGRRYKLVQRAHWQKHDSTINRETTKITLLREKTVYMCMEATGPVNCRCNN